MENIVRCIERHVESLSAVLIFPDQHLAAFTQYIFSALSAIFPKALVDNIAFISTSSSIGPPWIFSTTKYQKVLKSTPVFTFNNPIAINDKGSPVVQNNLEDEALNTLVELFDWLDDREPQPAKEIVSLYEKYQTIATILDQRAREVEIDRLMTILKKHSAVSLPSHCLHLALESYAHWR